MDKEKSGKKIDRSIEKWKDRETDSFRNRDKKRKMI